MTQAWFSPDLSLHFFSVALSVVMQFSLIGAAATNGINFPRGRIDIRIGWKCHSDTYRVGRVLQTPDQGRCTPALISVCNNYTGLTKRMYASCRPTLHYVPTAVGLAAGGISQI